MRGDMNEHACVEPVEAAVPPGHAEAFEAWRWAVSPFFRFDTLGERERYETAIWSANFDRIVLGYSDGSSSLFDRSVPTIARFCVEDVLVQFYRGQAYEATANGSTEVIQPGTLVLFDLTRPMSIRANVVANTSLTIPRALLAPLLANLDGLHGSVVRPGGALHGLLIDHMRAMRRHAVRTQVSEASAIADATAALVAACFGASAEGYDAAVRAVPAISLVRLRDFIEANLRDPRLGAAMIMRTFGVSRATLYRLFEPLGGVANFIAERRLAKVFRSLASGERERIGVVAARWGFLNSSSFSRAFRNAYGMSPSDVRAGMSAQRKGRASDAEPTTPGFAGIGRQVRGL